MTREEFKAACEHALTKYGRVAATVADAERLCDTWSRLGWGKLDDIRIDHRINSIEGESLIATRKAKRPDPLEGFTMLTTPEERFHD